jgi:hypothetical protein
LHGLPALTQINNFVNQFPGKLGRKLPSHERRKEVGKEGNFLGRKERRKFPRKPENRELPSSRAFLK